jgi:outer membrane protein assembly factor BamB
MMNHSQLMLLNVALAAMLIGSARAGDWPQWGNTPDRNMVAADKNLPSDWSPGTRDPKGDWDPTLKDARNVKWIAKLGSETYGNATVSNGKIFIGTNNASPKNPKYKGDRSVLMCFNEADGKFLWQLAVPKLKEGRVNDWPGIGICSSPTVDGDRVYLVTSRCELLCIGTDSLKAGNRGPFKDEAKYYGDPDKLNDPKYAGITTDDTDADIIWRMDMRDPDGLGVFPHNASNCSVLIDGDRLFCTSSNGVDWGHSYVPSALSPSYFAVNKNTGAELWEDELNLANTPREDCGLNRSIFHGIWSNPSMATVNGKKQVHYGGPDGILYALDAETGKLNWKHDCVLPTQKKMASGEFIRYPALKGPSEIDSTPVVYNNRIYVTNGQDPEHLSGGDGVLTCVDAATGNEVWHFDKIHRSISTPSIVDGVVFVSDFDGVIYCLDADKGNLFWKYETHGCMWGSTLVADGKIYFGNDKKEVYVMEASKVAPRVLSKVKLADYVRSTPIVANGVLYISSNTHLFAIAPKN